jgi:hypothetical protein
MKIRFIILGLILSTALAGCTSLAVIGHSGSYNQVKPAKVEKVNSAFKSDNGHIVICVTGKSPSMSENGEYSLLFSYDYIAQLQEKHYEKHSSDRVSNLLPSVVLPIGPKCSETVKSWSELTLLNANSSWDYHGKMSYVDAYPRINQEDTIYITPNSANLSDMWGSKELILSSAYSDGIEIRWGISGQEEIKEKNFNGKVLLPATIALDALTLPLQALWLVVSGISMGSQSHD